MTRPAGFQKPEGRANRAICKVCKDYGPFSTYQSVLLE